jgi:hypothetical protein
VAERLVRREPGEQPLCTRYEATAPGVSTAS